MELQSESSNKGRSFLICNTDLDGVLFVFVKMHVSSVSAVNIFS